jgi:hypothetical protein
MRFHFYQPGIKLTSVLAAFELGIADDFFSDFIKIMELLSREVKKFSPFICVLMHVTRRWQINRGARFRGSGDKRLFLVSVDQLQYKRASCNNTGSFSALRTG